MAATRDSITGPNGTSRAEVMRALIGCGLTTENNPKNGFDFIFSSFFFLLSLSFSLLSCLLFTGKGPSTSIPNSNLRLLHQLILFYPPPYFTSLYVPVCALVPIVRFAAPRWLPGQLSLLLLRLPSSFPDSD